MALKQRWRIGLVAMSAAMLVTACGDQEPVSPLAPRGISGAKNTTQSTSWTVGDTLFTTFNVTPAGGTFNIVGRKFRIDFPSNAICDLQTSSYGVSTWDDACTPETETVRVSSKIWLDAESHPHIDFQPAMRFSPTLANGVMLYLKDPNAQYRNDMTILYCVVDNGCYDESKKDPSLATFTDAKDQLVYRRIKHFSGYNVTARATSVDAEVTVDGTISVDATLP